MGISYISMSPRLHLPSRGHGLVYPPGAGLASVNLDGQRVRTDVVDEAVTKYGTPGIFNTGQGSQFTSAAFAGLLMRYSIRI